ncbi:nuclear transport factor 2 family protein [Rhizobium sp. S152]|uniref:nuclear transport factor 2 family protein n=1 Tax=Rhizobium sp. S152 TaxID=3055038 RepID=UPI0025A9F82D|nr:nuclear transport factor 2 family protein [Rhizobium sp. S152]MDM9627149.1 nuclear transport factor 2 family protein [Rhizobium sp. S152]
MTEENHTRREKTVRALYAAYIDGRKDIVAAMLTEDFTFSSPRDDHIGRDAYFDRCWPEPPPFERMEIEYLGIAGDEAVVRYRAVKRDGGAFRNMETFRFKGDKVAAVEVYFGRDA